MPKISKVPSHCLRDVCGVPLVPQIRGMGTRHVPEGHRRHSGRGLCDYCYDWARREPERLARFPPLTRDRAQTLARWAVLQAAGHTYATAARELGITPGALRQVANRCPSAPRSRLSRPAGTSWSRPQHFDPDTRDEGE